MIDIRVIENRAWIRSTGGGLDTLAAETIVVVNNIYNVLRKFNEEAAETYKTFITESMQQSYTWEKRDVGGCGTFAGVINEEEFRRQQEELEDEDRFD